MGARIVVGATVPALAAPSPRPARVTLAASGAGGRSGPASWCRGPICDLSCTYVDFRFRPQNRSFIGLESLPRSCRWQLRFMATPAAISGSKPPCPAVPPFPYVAPRA